MKTIVAISSTGQRGKTSSIVELSKNIPWEEAPEYYDYDGNLIDKPAGAGFCAVASTGERQ